MAAEEGTLDVKIDIKNKNGIWYDLAHSINHLLSSIVTPILEVNRMTDALAKGDLSYQFTTDSKGSILQLVQNLDKASNKLSELLNQITTHANTTDQSADEMLTVSKEMSLNTDEIASAMSQMSSGAQTQVMKVDEASRLVEMTLESSREMGEKAETINKAAKNVLVSSEKGKEMVQNIETSMNEITDFSRKTQESIQVLTARSKEITRVLSVITDIAAQTNLLALNAAIEAAQAGDAGRGFSVVAEEIRKLAENSHQSAKEIDKLVLDVQKDTIQAANIIESMSGSVKSGAEASAQAANVFSEMHSSADQNLTFSEEIVKSAKSQLTDIARIASITENIVVIAEQTASGTEQVASSTVELSAGMKSYNDKSLQLTEISSSLKASLNKFRLKA